MFHTEFEFVLPKGYVDEDGNLHKNGVMRLANAGDEILLWKDPRVQQNSAYSILILLSRVITKLGNVNQITPKTIEGLFSSDLSFLQEFYQRVNDSGSSVIKANCPKCDYQFEVDVDRLGEK